MKKIEILIKDGKATVKSEGYSGEACLKATAKYIKAMGRVVTDTPTNEMFETPETEHLRELQ